MCGNIDDFEFSHNFLQNFTFFTKILDKTFSVVLK